VRISSVEDKVENKEGFNDAGGNVPFHQLGGTQKPFLGLRALYQMAWAPAALLQEDTSITVIAVILAWGLPLRERPLLKCSVGIKFVANYQR
jgi:hypothetical protein